MEWKLFRREGKVLKVRDDLPRFFEILPEVLNSKRSFASTLSCTSFKLHALRVKRGDKHNWLHFCPTVSLEAEADTTTGPRLGSSRERPPRVDMSTTSYSAMFGARPSSVNIAGRRDVAGTSALSAGVRDRLQNEIARPSPSRRTLRTPKPLHPQATQLNGNDKENNNPQVQNAQAKDAFRKRVVISPSQWFSKTQNTPKATRCTIRDSPSHAVAIANLRNNNRVQVLRELHKKIIQSSTQAIKEQPSGPAVAETVTDAPSPSMSPTSAAAAMSPSPTIPIPFNIRVEEKLDEAGPVWPENAGSDELAQSGGWKVVSEDAAVLSVTKATGEEDAPQLSPEKASESLTPLKAGSQKSDERDTEHEAKQATSPVAQEGGATHGKSTGALWYMPNDTLSTTLSTPARGFPLLAKKPGTCT